MNSRFKMQRLFQLQAEYEQATDDGARLRILEAAAVITGDIPPRTTRPTPTRPRTILEQAEYLLSLQREAVNSKKKSRSRRPRRKS